MKRIDAYWYSQNPVAWLLLPVTVIYCLLVLLRRLFYRLGLFKTHNLPVPVIVVGNISVGGTGKTPLLIALCDLLKAHGYKPGVISRGYDGSFTGVHRVHERDNAELVGDEPCLIVKRTGCPLVVGRDRVAAAELLLESADCNIILSDDGLQHYRLGRDIEITVIDIGRRFGNGFCLPSGPLREPVSRLQQVDIVVDHCADAAMQVAACREDNFSLQFLDAINLKTGELAKLETFSGRPLHAIAGIGHPARFFNQLKKLGLQIIEHAFPDHHKFVENDFMFADDYCVLMTEKDAVKCHASAAENLWYVPVTVSLSDRFQNNFLARVKALTVASATA